jgi:hypothetical protein
MSGTKSLAYQRVFVWHTRPFGWPVKTRNKNWKKEGKNVEREIIFIGNEEHVVIT